jgi:hypothetical protein
VAIVTACILSALVWWSGRGRKLFARGGERQPTSRALCTSEVDPLKLIQQVALIPNGIRASSACAPCANGTLYDSDGGAGPARRCLAGRRASLACRARWLPERLERSQRPASRRQRRRQVTEAVCVTCAFSHHFGVFATKTEGADPSRSAPSVGPITTSGGRCAGNASAPNGPASNGGGSASALARRCSAPRRESLTTPATR